MFYFFFFNDTATTEIYTLSLHDALPIWNTYWFRSAADILAARSGSRAHEHAVCDGDHRHSRHLDLHERGATYASGARSEEHTSELQSRQYLVCRLLLEKKKTISILLLIA